MRVVGRWSLVVDRGEGSFPPTNDQRKTKNDRRLHRAFTLIELLVAVTIVAVVSAALSEAFVVGIDFGRHLDETRGVEDRRHLFEQRMRNLLQAAWLSSDETDPYSYFVASVGGSAAAGGGNTGGGDADTLTFTAAQLRPSYPYLESLDDFDTLNQTYGPQGGTTEIAITMTPYGDSGGQTGLFLRKQRPADGDPTQGGYEEVFDPEVEAIRFEFYDGQQWVTDWDSGVAGEHRLPASIRIYYRVTGEANERSFVVKLPLSDVTPDNPAGAGGGIG